MYLCTYKMVRNNILFFPGLEIQSDSTPGMPLLGPETALAGASVDTAGPRVVRD